MAECGMASNISSGCFAQQSFGSGTVSPATNRIFCCPVRSLFDGIIFGGLLASRCFNQLWPAFSKPWAPGL